MKQQSTIGPEVVYVCSPGLPCSIIMRATSGCQRPHTHNVDIKRFVAQRSGAVLPLLHLQQEPFKPTICLWNCKWDLVTQHLLESCLSGASCHKATASGSSLRHEPQCIFTCPSSFNKSARRLRQCEEKYRCACFLH